MDARDNPIKEKPAKKEEIKTDLNAPVAIFKDGVTRYRSPSEVAKYKELGWTVK